MEPKGAPQLAADEPATSSPDVAAVLVAMDHAAISVCDAPQAHNAATSRHAKNMLRTPMCLREQAGGK